MKMKSVRVDNLIKQIGDHQKRGRVAEFARAHNLDPTYIRQLLSGHRPIGEKAARNIEGAIGLPPGSLDVVDGDGITGEIKTRKVPLIAWVAAGGWCESHDNHAPGDAEEWLDCPFPFSKSAFCLAVVGDSMSPEYREGEYILVDPAIEAAHGDDVVAREPDGRHTFKRLQVTPEGIYLLALNPDHPNRKIEIPADTRICGVVTGSWMRRRKLKGGS